MPWPFRNRRQSSPEEPPVAVLLPEPLGAQIDVLVAQGREVDAVRLVRRRTDLGLLTAYRAVQYRRGPDQ